MTMTLRERRRLQLQEEILAAARQLMSQKGFSGMSMDEVAAQAGISKPTLYSFFATKEDLVISAITQRLDLGIRALEEDLDPPSPIGRLCELIRMFIKHQSQEETNAPRPWSPEVFQLMLGREDSLSRMRRMEQGVAALVEAARRKGELDPTLETAMVVRLFFAMFGAAHTHSFSGLSRPNQASIGETLASVFERGVRAYPPTTKMK